MAVFERLFTELFKQKSKKAHLMIMLQFVSALVTTIFNYFESTGEMKFVLQKENGFLTFLFVIFFLFSFLFLPIYLIVTSLQNERINHSQTWRLAPMSDDNIYLDNMLSSFVNFIYLALLQTLGSIFLFGLSYLFNKQTKNGWDEMLAAIRKGNQSRATLTDLLGIVLIAILLGLLVYLVISFLNFTSQAIVDFLPAVSSKFIVTIIRLILIIAIMWLLTRVYLFVKPIVASPLSYLLGEKELELWPAVGLFTIIDVVLAAVNMFLISKFFEAKQNK
ncbi:hypothetical protein OZX58_04325 [Lactobacillus sp. ESL0680]|uniref:hypothetical protein n=1 Tax=Lactobacillus sp. ESL0680 TaxID=2983210 RepID=UPI0023F68FD2|nr:hypothetical protein [Lactobacillus sp. ESL0680]WEV37982.1 hypothetical protein OZX58_04325 [Lactobacillus sp. ESL0680]